MSVTTQTEAKQILPGGVNREAVDRFVSCLHAGADWVDALLEAVALWTAPEEVFRGRRFQYLVGQEAFDWLLLAERLLLNTNGLVPEEERDRLLFKGALPRRISDQEFKEKVGAAKYRGVMNYWYGVLVEEALVLAVEHEVRKQRRGLRPEDPRLDDAVYERAYGQTLTELLRRFFQERSLPPAGCLTLTESKEFTYWLFKYRLRSSDPARLASDTKKALDFLRVLGREAPHGG